MSEQAALHPDSHEGPPPSEGHGADPYQLHDDAIKASALLEKIATGLGHSGASQDTTKAFGAMADSCRELATAMSRAPAPEPKAAPAAAGGQRETMDSATNDLAAQAQRR